MPLTALKIRDVEPRRTGSERPLSADDIARRVQDRDTGRDSRAAMRMKLFDRQGRSASARSR